MLTGGQSHTGKQNLGPQKFLPGKVSGDRRKKKNGDNYTQDNQGKKKLFQSWETFKFSPNKMKALKNLNRNIPINKKRKMQGPA